MKMKTVLAVAVFINISLSSVIPKNMPTNISHHDEGDSRYFWMPDDNGKLHLLDLHKPVVMNSADNNPGANNQYWLYTRNNPSMKQDLIHGDITSIRRSNYRANRGLAVVVHGWTGDGNNPMNRAIRATLIMAHDFNIISVDWNQLSNEDYFTAAYGVLSVGQHLGDFLSWLILNAGGNWHNVHLIGFSLGAHIVGVAGRRAVSTVSRVTGLDPAGPLWNIIDHRLSSNAARYVEVIHTDGSTLGLGIGDPSGHADFYPNRGVHPQPGCEERGHTTCSHSRAWDLFASSVQSPNWFPSWRCNNMTEVHNDACVGLRSVMGNTVFSKTASGIFATRTGSRWPF